MATNGPAVTVLESDVTAVVITVVVVTEVDCDGTNVG